MNCHALYELLAMRAVEVITVDDPKEVRSTPSSPSSRLKRHEASPGTRTTADAPDLDPAEADTDGEAEWSHCFAADDTMMIFDWDDTVLPSSWVQEQGLRLDEDIPLSQAQRAILGEFTRIASDTLRLAKKLGTVVLLTNAERGWIELSCHRFLPQLFPLLEGVRLISARSEYESPQLPSPFDWKLRAFSAELTRVFDPNFRHRRKNVLSFGDSAHEREALLRTTALLPNCRAKSLKFVDQPSLGELCRQHLLVTQCFRQIVHHDGNLDLCINAM